MMIHVVLAVVLVLCGSSRAAIYTNLVQPGVESYTLPELPYGYGDLEPHIDSRTLKVHHQGHHKGYKEKTNAALKSWRGTKVIVLLGGSSVCCVYAEHVVYVLQRVSSNTYH